MNISATLPSRSTQGIGVPTSKYAFATYLSSLENQDHYFIATRILTYQLLHAPETRSAVPFLVLVGPELSESKRVRLRRDGAIVIEVDHLSRDWVKTSHKGWENVMDKLRLWELTDYDLIALLDADTILTRPLDGVFSDPAVVEQHAATDTRAIRGDEGQLPDTYVFAGQPEVSRDHGYPPEDASHDYSDICADDFSIPDVPCPATSTGRPSYYLNAGFFVLRPSLQLFRYYQSLLALDKRFNPQLPEQNLLNYAHRLDGNMPWRVLNYTWNMHFPTERDLHEGVASLHEKWWDPAVPELRSYLQSWRWRMEGYYEAKDQDI